MAMTLTQFIVAATAWVSSNTPYTDITPPNYAQLDETQMQAFGQNRLLLQNGNAYYLCSGQTMIVRTDIDLRNIYHQSIVVHEVVHHGQCTAHRMGNDPCAKEREAYAAQINYLRYRAAHATADKLQAWLDTNPRLCR